MKKIGLFLFAVLALCLTACTAIQIGGQDDGTISLTIGDALASEIRSAASLRSGASGDASYSLTASVRGDYTARQSVTVTSASLAAATFTFEQIPAGGTVVLDIAVQSGGAYIWYGNSGNHVVSRGPNNLSIAIGRVSGVLMWNSSTVKIVPYGNYSAAGWSIQNPKNPPVWCFDNKGNLYVLDSSYGGLRYNLKADGTYPSSNDGTYSNSNALTALSSDNATDTLYGMDDSKLYKLTSGSGSSQVPNVSLSSPDGFAVYDNAAYVADCVSDDATITIKSYDVNSGSALGSGSPFKLPDALGTSPSCQMVFQDGALYLSLRNVKLGGADDDHASHYSVGAIAKVNPATLSLDTSFGDGGYLGLAPVSTFAGTKDDGSVVTADYHGPRSGGENAAFYGPVGFVAVMPKKLVIADAGFAMEQGQGKVRLTKKSRVVTVDLATLAFDSTDVDNAYYQDDSIYSSLSSYEYITEY